jgi:ABC-type maltose transport system permease subunit
MKNLIAVLLIAVFALITPNTQAQSSVLVPSTDTLSNTDTAFISLPTATGGYYAVGIQAVVSKVSGTVAGTAIIQGSLDGTNYVDIGTDTLTFTNVATNTKVWAITPSVYQYHRVKFLSSGTVVAVPKVRYRLIRLLTN